MSDADVKELEELKLDIQRLKHLEREGRATEAEKALLAQYLIERRELEAKLQLGACLPACRPACLPALPLAWHAPQQQPQSTLPALCTHAAH